MKVVWALAELFSSRNQLQLQSLALGFHPGDLEFLGMRGAGTYIYFDKFLGASAQPAFRITGLGYRGLPWVGILKFGTGLEVNCAGRLSPWLHVSNI